MAYRNKTYIAFDGDNDINYFNIMKAWKYNDDIDFDFYDAHELTQAHDWAKTESIKRSLKNRLDNSKLFILLIGEHTKKLTKFVKYEVETAMRLSLPIICVNLNGENREDDLSPSWFEEYPRIYIPFKEEIIKYAIEHWPKSQNSSPNQGAGAYRYKD